MAMLLDLSLAFLMLGFVEAVIKPIARKFVQRNLITALPAVFEALDPIMPELIRQYSASELEGIVRGYLTKHTGEDWSERSVDVFFQLYDPRRNAARYHHDE